ncbi:hypothetical protein T484DRAFT_1942938 [Baffinella frigidus]|nr:hypothetical protein T484DRAFT_1942938 [Cryptophyta sp. CCMP2293]
MRVFLLVVALHTCESFLLPSLAPAVRPHAAAKGLGGGRIPGSMCGLGGIRRAALSSPRMGLFDDLASKVRGAMEEATVQHILVKTESEAVTIRKEMSKAAGKAPVTPQQFGEYAARHSTCGSAKKTPGANMAQLRGLPGEMSFRRGQTEKAFEKAAFEGAPGALQGPIKTQFGYHLVLVNPGEEVGGASGAGGVEVEEAGEESKSALKKKQKAKEKRGK